MLNGQRVLGLSGRKQAGKDTACNFLTSLALVHFRVTPRAFIDEKTGQLIIQNGPDENQLGILDLSNRDPEYTQWAKDTFWPFVKRYSYATHLKNFCIDVMGLTEEQVYGTNEQKNTLTQYLWENMPIPQNYYQTYIEDGEHLKFNGDELYFRNIDFKTGLMTAREVLQYVGTEIGRQMYSNLWVDSCIRTILKEESGQALINDARFPNEVEAIQKVGGKVIRLTKVVNPEDKHESETALDRENFDWSKFDAVIDNQNLGIHDTHAKIFQLLIDWEWICV